MREQHDDDAGEDDGGEEQEGLTTAVDGAHAVDVMPTAGRLDTNRAETTIRCAAL